MIEEPTELEERIQVARQQLNFALSTAKNELAAYKNRNQPTEEDIGRLHESALRGELGTNMQELARRIDAGEDSWDAVFSGASPNVELLRAHLDRMIAQNRDALAAAAADDEELEQLRQEITGEPAQPRRATPPPGTSQRPAVSDDDDEDFTDFNHLR